MSTPNISRNFNASTDSRLKERSLRRIAAATVAVAFFTMFLRQGWTYDKPYTYSHDKDKILFMDQYMNSPHTWTIVKAVELLRQDGYHAEADLAQHYLLPMLEGATFNDVWGDADLAGASVLDYYIPEKPNQNFGYGTDQWGIYKNSTFAFQTHPFYGYGNAAEHAQFRYEYALRVYRGNWGSDPRDWMAGWVVDTWFGQDDPMDGKWANGADAINGQTRFGRHQTPASALRDLLNNHCRYQVIFPQYPDEDWLSKIFIPTKDVFDHAPEWLDDHFNDADDISAVQIS